MTGPVAYCTHSRGSGLSAVDWHREHPAESRLHQNPLYEHPFRQIVGTGRVHLLRCRDCGEYQDALRHQYLVALQVDQAVRA